MRQQGIKDTLNIALLQSDSMITDSSIMAIHGHITGEIPVEISGMGNKLGFLIIPPYEQWIFYYLFALLIGFAIARIFLGNLFTNTFIAATRYNSAASMFNDNSQLQRLRDSILNVFYFFSTALFLVFISGYFEIEPYRLTGLRLMILYFGVILVYFYSRILIVNFIGHVFYSKTLASKYMYLLHFYNKLAGVVLIPLNFLIAFTRGNLQEILLILSLVTLGIIFLMKIIRGVVFSLKHNVLKFYLFLYLCALEIVPILMIYNWFRTIV